MLRLIYYSNIFIYYVRNKMILIVDNNKIINNNSKNKLVFDRNYIGIGRITGREKGKKDGKVQTIQIELFPDIRHLLKWKAVCTFPLGTEDFRDLGDFPKLIWNLKELGNCINSSFMIDGKEYRPIDMIDRNVLDRDGVTLGKVVDVKCNISDKETSTLRVVLMDKEEITHPMESKKEVRIPIHFISKIKKDIMLSRTTQELQEEWSEVITERY